MSRTNNLLASSVCVFTLAFVGCVTSTNHATPNKAVSQIGGPVVIAWASNDEAKGEQNTLLKYSVPASFTATTARIMIQASIGGYIYTDLPNKIIRLDAGKDGVFDMSRILAVCELSAKLDNLSGVCTMSVALFDDLSFGDTNTYGAALTLLDDNTALLEPKAIEAYGEQVSNGLKIERAVAPSTFK